MGEAIWKFAEKRTELIHALEIAKAKASQASRDEMERVMQDALLSGDPDGRRKLAQVLRETIRQVVFDDDRVHFYAKRGQGALVATFTNGAVQVTFEREWKKKDGE
jgi:hypothetical protein